jgi:putative ABC transport system permease protein
VTPVWRKAPWWLLRYPGLFAALVTGAVLIVVTVAAYPLFLSSTRDRLVETTVEDATVTPYGAGITYTATNVRFSAESPDGNGPLYERRRQLFAAAAAASPTLGSVIEQIRGDQVAITDESGRAPQTGPVNGALFAGTDALDHVRVLEGADGPGVWLPDFVAKQLHAHAGDTVDLGSGDNVVPVTVDGVYRALYAQPQTGYWRVWSEDIYPCALCAPPPQPILVEPRQLVRLATQLGDPKADFALEAPIRDPGRLTLDEARGLQGFALELRQRMRRSGPDAAFNAVFACCGNLFSAGGLGLGGHVTNVQFLTAIQDVVLQAERRMASVRPPLLVVVLAGMAISLSVVAAAGLFSFSSRRVEAGVLAARGWSPVKVGAKAMVESTLPCCAGGALGSIIALWGIALFGPHGAIEPTARGIAIEAAVVAVLVSVVLVGTVSGLSFRSGHESRRRRAIAALQAPWELLLFAAAFLLIRRLGRAGSMSGGGFGYPDVSVFLIPLVLALGIAMVVARGATFALRRRRVRPTTRISAWYLARSRLSSSARLATLFLLLTSGVLCVFTSSQGMVASLRATVEAKARTFVGSDVQLRVGPDTTTPTDFPFDATIVNRVRQAGYLPGGELQFDLLTVDPATFASATYWNRSFSTTEPTQLLDRLDGEAYDGVLPMILANGGGLAPSFLEMQQRRFPIDIVARTAGFPGMSSSRPLLIVDDAALSRSLDGGPDPRRESVATREMWIRGPTDLILAAASQAGIVSYATLTAAEVEDIPFIQAAVNTYIVLEVIGAVALLLTLIIAVMYLQAREHDRVVASMLSLRMGARRLTMRRALAIELGVVLTAGLLIGAVTGSLGVKMLVVRLDPLPSIPPGPIWVAPLIAIGATAILIVAVAAGAARITERSSQHVRAGEVLRVAG